jgi:rRNA processing protein Krr1/Pno1|eukprot:CAMPEP_0169126216 /NCGR_PEP_ID=MMETSP1015-20121227/35324_1 /TAXON_ID=342587 /ORGANISM="Karlodinium micrum, Strain CCMP2283" /LENGTH=494 /DNA_ID=CAMNT_0009189853 /DNA_START=68 /DNA_END=1552 /DNA_ORIENTATION=-
MATEEAQGMSKSARKRANKKAREAADEIAEEPPAPEPKAAAKPKAAPKQPAEKVTEPKAKGKSEAKAKPKAVPKDAAKEEPVAAVEAKPKPKADSKPKSVASKPAAKPKAKASNQDEEEQVTKKEELINYVIDDGSGGDWEQASGLTKKQQKQKEKKEEEKKLAEELKRQGVGKASAVNAQQLIPGMMPPEVVAAQMKAGKAEPKANQSVAVVGISAAALEDKGKAPEKPSVESFTATVKIPENKIGWVIGPKGATIAMLKEKTNVKNIDTQGGVCTIIGDKDAVAMAEAAVLQLIEKGYTALAYDNYEEAGVMVHPQHFHQIIGEKGAVIQLIKKEAKVEVTMPEAPKSTTSSKKYKVTLAGSKDAVEKGKEIINSIVSYGYHPITHPDFTHQELEVEEWKYKYLIGTKGSEMRHIQNSFKVKVNIPRPGSENQNVVVVGDQLGVERAVKYIEKVLYNAEVPKGRGNAEQAVDTWGDEEPEEDWMKAYMYKRK